MDKLGRKDDICPRCGGSFEATGGRPKTQPYICQKCFMETQEDSPDGKD